ncbi:MAG TPA: rod shape-determining protein MreC [Candidatus Paceibacterota bacterium]|nr:rod shape-determining protein MreC [Candidatus Paceibacterota bacterium]
MRRSRRLIAVVVILAIIVAGNALLFSGRLTGWIGDGGRIFAPVSGIAAKAHAFIGIFATRIDLARENLSLQVRVTELEHQQADTEALTRELALARAAAGLTERGAGQMIEAGIIAWPQDGGVRELTIDRGTADGVADGDVATSVDGALVGVVRDVTPRRATVTGVGDPSLQIAAGVMGSSVTGLVRFDGQEGLILDLVRKGEALQEGQTAVTSGSDGMPAGLVIGTIRSVELPAASLFALVRLSAAVDVQSIGSVIVLRP